MGLVGLAGGDGVSDEVLGLVEEGAGVKPVENWFNSCALCVNSSTALPPPPPPPL